MWGELRSGWGEALEVSWRRPRGNEIVAIDAQMAPRVRQNKGKRLEIRRYPLQIFAVVYRLGGLPLDQAESDAFPGEVGHFGGG
jgi:hypothetical protein